MNISRMETWVIPEFIEPEKRNNSWSLKAFESSVKTKGRLYKTYMFADGTICRVFQFRNILAPCGVCGQLSLTPVLLVGVDENGFISGYWKKCDKCQALLDAKEGGYSYTADEIAAIALAEADVPNLSILCRFENFRPQEIDTGLSKINTLKAFSHKTDYGEHPINTVLLFGNTGTGKTHLAVSAMYNYFLNNTGKKGRYIKQSALMDQVKASYGKGDEFAHVKAAFFSYDILVIDEVGRLQITANSTNVFQEILQDRIENGKKTILCGNVKLEDLEEILGKQNLSRFKATGKILSIEGEDFREKYGKL